MAKPDPPSPPNPMQTAAAATSTNIGTSIANAWLNQTNQNTPWGSLSYNQTGTHKYTDPTTGASYDIPSFTASQELSPSQKYSADNTEQAQIKMAELANVRGNQLFGHLKDPMDLSAAPMGGMAQWLADMPNANYTFADTGQQQGTFGEAGDIVRGYGPADDFSADRGRVEEALYGRLNPQLDRERANIEQRLADQGIRYGSEAYARAMDDYNRQANDMRLAVTQAGGAEQQRMMDMAAKEAGFQNAAQMQAYQQAMGRGEFANTAQAQAFAQAQARGSFYNTAAAQNLAGRQSWFNAANAERQRYMQEQYAQRNQPLNEVSSLMSGSQVQMPSWVNTPSTQIPTTDVAGIINTGYNQQFQNYQQQSQNFNSVMGGIFGMIGGLGGGYLRSDRRVKEDIDKVGSIFAAGPDGERPLPIYEYSYKDDPAGRRHTGPMAQDVERIDKRAVKTRGGVKHIDMTRMGSILRAA